MKTFNIFAPFVVCLLSLVLSVLKVAKGEDASGWFTAFWGFGGLALYAVLYQEDDEVIDALKAAAQKTVDAHLAGRLVNDKETLMAGLVEAVRKAKKVRP